MEQLNRGMSQGEYSVVHISFPSQGEERDVEQDNLTPLATEAVTALVKAPGPAGDSLPGSPLPTNFLRLCSKPDPLMRGD